MTQSLSEHLFGMNRFKPHISVAYPPNNAIIFEEWFSENYSGCQTDRELIPAWFTSFWVNNNYGNDLRMKQEMQEFVDGLDRGKKWFCITQYDDSVLIDFKDLDVFRFEMSKPIGVGMPLLCQPNPYKFYTDKKWIANFVGSKTHPIRDSAEKLMGNNGYYISFEHHSIETYCRILHESMFTLCYRGYGLNSFRCVEAMQYGSIPVYISDQHINPFDLDFNEYGVLVNESDKDNIHEILTSLSPIEIINKQDRLKEVYESNYTYEGAKNQIIKHLATEYNNRQQGGKIGVADEGIEESGDFRF